MKKEANLSQSSANATEYFSIGDIVECPYSVGNITRFGENGIISLSMISFSGKGYPALTLGVHKSNIKRKTN